MSSHCGRFPKCGCPDYVGIHCQLPTMEEAIAANMGMDRPPTEEEIDEAIKQSALDMQQRIEASKRAGEKLSPSRPLRSKHGRNYTPPKRRHRKK